MPVLGYYSHVDVETSEAAEAAGVDLVVPRSRMARELPELVERLLRAAEPDSASEPVERLVDVERLVRAGRARGPRRPSRARTAGSNGAGARSGRGPAAAPAVRRGRGSGRRRAGRRGPASGCATAKRVAARRSPRRPRRPARGRLRASRARRSAPAPGRAGRRMRSTLKTRIGTPCSRSATPSAFQKPVAASTLPAASEATALKPIVTRSTSAGSPPSALDLGVDHRFVGGQAGDADRAGPRGRAGRRTAPSPRAITAASGRCTIGITPTRSRPLLAGDAEVVDVEDREVGAAGGEQLRRVGRFARLADRQVDARRRGRSPAACAA